MLGIYMHAYKPCSNGVVWKNVVPERVNRCHCETVVFTCGGWPIGNVKVIFFTAMVCEVYELIV